jgi:hypothetical protein
LQVFSKLEHTASLDVSGTGLGLALCDRLCQLMGGWGVRISSTLGAGSSFCCDFPLCRADEGYSPATGGGGAPLRGGGDAPWSRFSSFQGAGCSASSASAARASPAPPGGGPPPPCHTAATNTNTALGPPSVGAMGASVGAMGASVGAMGAGIGATTTAAAAALARADAASAHSYMDPAVHNGYYWAYR